VWCRATRYICRLQRYNVVDVLSVCMRLKSAAANLAKPLKMVANRATLERSVRQAKSASSAQLVIPLPAGFDAAAVSGLGESVSRALQAVMKQGSQQLIERAAAVAVAAVYIAAPSTELIEEHIAQRRTMKCTLQPPRPIMADDLSVGQCRVFGHCRRCRF
jgi:hypothetical protein